MPAARAVVAALLLCLCAAARALQAVPEQAPPATSAAPGGASSCDLCGGRQQWLFIVATGRSGSTTMLEMLNAVPGFYLTGENYGVMDKVMRLYDSHANASSRAKAGDPRFQANNQSETRLLCSLQAFVRAALGEFSVDRTSVVGFKEIRHTTPEQRALWKKVFPCGRFVVNTRRDVAKQHGSQFQKYLSLSSLESYTKDLERWQARHAEDVHRLQLEDYSVGSFNQLLRSLGVSGCNYTDVAWANRRGGWKGDDSHARLAGKCQIPRWRAEGDGPP